MAGHIATGALRGEHCNETHFRAFHELFCCNAERYFLYRGALSLSKTYPVFHKANFYFEKYGREPFDVDPAQRSRAIIPGDDPGDQQHPERRVVYPILMLVSAGSYSPGTEASNPSSSGSASSANLTSSP